MDTPTVQPDKGRNSAAIAKLVLLGVLVVLFVVFAIQSSASVGVEFPGWEVQMRRIALMLASAAVGIAVWELAGFSRRRRRGRQGGEVRSPTLAADDRRPPQLGKP